MAGYGGSGPAPVTGTPLPGKGLSQTRVNNTVTLHWLAHGDAAASDVQPVPLSEVDISGLESNTYLL